MGCIEYSVVLYQAFLRSLVVILNFFFCLESGFVIVDNSLRTTFFLLYILRVSSLRLPLASLYKDASLLECGFYISRIGPWAVSTTTELSQPPWFTYFCSWFTKARRCRIWTLLCAFICTESAYAYLSDLLVRRVPILSYDFVVLCEFLLGQQVLDLGNKGDERVPDLETLIVGEVEQLVDDFELFYHLDREVVVDCITDCLLDARNLSAV